MYVAIDDDDALEGEMGDDDNEICDEIYVALDDDDDAYEGETYYNGIYKEMCVDFDNYYDDDDAFDSEVNYDSKVCWSWWWRMIVFKSNIYKEIYVALNDDDAYEGEIHDDDN